MSFLDQLEEEKKKQQQGSFLSGLETKKIELQKNAKPSQVAAAEQKAKQPGLIERAKSKIGEMFSKKKDEPVVTITKAGDEQIVPPVDEKVTFDTVSRSFRAGWGDVLSTTGQAASWLGKDGVASKLATNGAKYQKVGIEQNKEFSWKDLYDPYFYATTVTRSLPMSLALMPAAVVGAYASASTAAAVGIGMFGRTLIGAIGGAALSRPLESALEAGGTYDEMLKKGKTTQEADEAANKTFKGNLALGSMDAIEFALAFMPGKSEKAVTGLLRKVVKTTAKTAGSMAMEGAEEVVQRNIQLYSQGEGLDITSKQAQEEFAIGSLMGGGLGVTGEIYNKVKESVSTAFQQPYQKALNEKIAKGVDPAVAELQALDEVSTSHEEEVKQIVADTIDQLTTPLEVTTEQDTQPTGATTVQDNLQKAIDQYKSDQGVTISPKGEVNQSPALTELTDLSKQPEVVAITQEAVKTLPTNEDGTITLYRVGTPRAEDNRLVSATTTMEAAEQFKELAKQPDRPITEIKVKPEDIKVMIGGTEKEVLVQNPAVISGKPAENGKKVEKTLTTSEEESIGSTPIYHGTANKFDKFDLEKSGEVQVGDWGAGIYFADKPDIAKGFAKVSGGDIVMERYAPDVKFADAKKMMDDMDFQNALDRSNDVDPEALKDFMKSRGYGGVKVQHTTDGGWNEYVVFDPNDIKKKEEIVDKPTNDIKLGTKTEEQVGYGPGHPWYYKEGGKPLTGDEIKSEAQTDVDKLDNQQVEDSLTFWNDGKNITENKALEIKNKAAEDLTEDMARYDELLKQGMDAMSEPSPDEMDYYQSLGLKHNHIYNDERRIIEVDRYLESLKPTTKKEIKYTVTKTEVIPGKGNRVVGVEKKTIAKSDTIKPNDKPSVQPQGLPDSSQLPAGSDKGSGSETPKQTQDVTPAVPSEPGTGSLGDRSQSGGRVSRQQANVEAVDILSKHKYSTDAKQYTVTELEKLRRYTGSGGKADAGATGKGLLSEYYTPTEVVSKMWQIVKELVPDAKTALEPSIGTGVLLNGRPSTLTFTGYEYQRDSGTIAKLLNQDVDVKIGTGEEFGNPGNFELAEGNNQYDLVIGNPPFGERASFLKGKGNEPKIGRWEEYFIKKGLDQLKDNGTLVYVVNSSFLEKGTSYAKEAISNSGVLVKAYRLPEGIFSDTSVGTDIVVFKKGTSFIPAVVEARLTTLQNGNYFRSNPDNILGTVESRKNRFGKDETFVRGTIADIERINGNLVEPEKEVTVAPSEKPQNNRHFINFRDTNGTKFREVKGEKVDVGGGLDAFVYRDGPKSPGHMDNWVVTEGQSGMSIAREGTKETVIEKAKQSVKQFGPKETQRVIDQAIKEYGISPRYKKDVAAKPEVKKAEPVEAYAVATTQKIRSQAKEGILPVVIKPDKKTVEVVPSQLISGGNVTTDPIELELLKSIDVVGTVPYSPKAKKYLNFQGGSYYHDVNYFSGDIYEKLDQLKSDKNRIITELGQEQYDKQLKGLESIKPQPVLTKDVNFDPLDRYITQFETTAAEEGGRSARKLIDDFVDYVRSTDVALSYGVFKYDVVNYVKQQRASPGSKDKMGSIKKDSARLFNFYVRDVLPTDIQEKIMAQYNREKNSYVIPDYSKIPIEVKGMAKHFRGQTFTLSDTQANGVSFLTNKGVGLVAYGVGVGKTHTLLVATEVAHEKGWTKRPAFIVPKSTITKTWIGTIKSMFPGKTIVNLGGLNKPDVERMAKVRGRDPHDWIHDGDITVITHEGLLRLALSPEDMQGATADLMDAMGSDDATGRQAEKEISKAQEIVGKAQYKAGEILLSDLGIDHISVDEVHNFRKVFQGAKPESVNPDGTVDKSKTRRFGNVIGGTPSKQAQQLFLISQYILKNNNGRGVYLASATPFENHATEVYNILSFMARERMKRNGIYNINDFFALYSNFETELDKNVKGEWINKEKMKSFKNVQQLQKLLREFVDKQEDPTLVRPKKVVMTPHLQMSTPQEENLAQIMAMLKPASGKKAEEGSVLKASTYSVANSISPYFIKEYHPEIVTPEELVDNSPKLKYAMGILKHLLTDPKTSKYGTFIYVGANGVEYHNHLADYAVRHVGLKPKEVAVINGSTPNDLREQIKDDFNAGKIKLLVGGDPTKEGIDLQNNGYTTINVAMGWNPTEIEQVSGRVWRQGNKRNIAPIIYPLVENSADITIFNKFEEKGGRINDLFSYQGQVFDVGELDPREKKLALMTNPEDKASLEIELDKVEMQNKAMTLTTDVANIKRVQENILSSEQRIKDYEERIKLGKTSWGSPLTPEQIAQYRKELTKAKKTLAGDQAYLTRRDITDVGAAISRITGEQEATNIEIGKINETYQSRLVKFQKQYDEMIAARKTIEDHVEDFKASTRELKEQSSEEIATQKAYLMQQQVTKGMKVPSGTADIGGYADIEPSGVTVERLRGIEFPELVSMVKELTGSAPVVRNLRNALGRLQSDPSKAQIRLNPLIFEDAITATKILSHEIGHLADWIPDGYLTRGNILGRIASLNKFMENKYGDLATNKEIRNELKNLTQLWKPFKEDTNPKFTSYRYSSKELYADAVSVLLNDPGLLKQQAPLFYEGFFEYLHNKPEFEQAYFDTMEFLNKGEEYVNNKRLESMYKGFKEAREKRAEIENTKKPKKPWIERLIRNHVTKFDPIYRDLSKVNPGMVESPKQKVREALEIMQMRRNDQALFLDRVTTELTDPLEAIGLSEDDLGVVLALEREAMGDRADLANPEGIVGKIPEVLLDHFYKTKKMSPEQITVFTQVKERFHEMIFAESQRAVDNGNFNKEVFEEKILPNKNTYATFSVVEYIHANFIGAGIKKQTGTLKTIENPFTSSILKTVALIDWNNIQEAKQVTVGELKQYFPQDVTEAKATRTNKGTVLKFAREDNKEVLEMMDNGRKVGFNVDPFIKSMFDAEHITADEMHGIVAASRGFNKIFKPLVTTWNLSWGFYSNIVRDTKRTYTHLGAALAKFAPDQKNLSIGELLSTWVKSIPEGAQFAAGKRTDLIREMMGNKAMGGTWAQYDPHANDETSIAFLLREHKLLPKIEQVGKVRKVWDASFGKVLKAIEFAGGTFEATSKISGYQLAKKRISDGNRLGFITRNYVGTPNYNDGGAWKQVDNDTFVFSNVMIQATRASAELAVDPKSAGAYWMRTFLVDIAPKMLMVAALAGLFGKKVKDNYERQTEYDKTNYITIPMGFDENGKAVYARLPQDETGRFVSAIVYKALSGLVQGKVIKPTQILSLGAGYIPSVTPLWQFMGDWMGYFQGRNPYDSYRGRLAIEDVTWKAGGMPRLSAMVQYSLNTIGLSHFTTYDPSNKTTTQIILDNIPIINRAVKISDFGIQEKFASENDSEAAKKTLAKREIIAKYVSKSKGVSDPAQLKAMREAMITEYFGDLPEKGDDNLDEARRMSSKFTIDRERGASPYTDKIINSNTNAEKVDYLLQFRKEMRDDDFREWVNRMHDLKIISDDVVLKLKASPLESMSPVKDMLAALNPFNPPKVGAAESNPLDVIRGLLVSGKKIGMYSGDNYNESVVYPFDVRPSEKEGYVKFYYPNNNGYSEIKKERLPTYQRLMQENFDQWKIGPYPDYAPDFTGKRSMTKTELKKIVTAVPEEGRGGAAESVPLVAKSLKDQGIYSKEVLAYALATMQHETAGSMRAVNEGFFNDQKFNYPAGFTGKSEARKRKYEGGENYYGRGYIQLTHKANYKEYGDELGIDLVKNPELANDPKVAADIMAVYFKKRGVADLASKKKFVEARRAINPDNKGKLISQTAQRYLKYIE